MSSSLKVNQLSGAKKTKQVTRKKDATKLVTEEELLKKDFISPEDVCNLEGVTQGKCCYY